MATEADDIDQLKKKLNQVSGQEKLDVLYDIVIYYDGVSYNDACEYLSQYLELAEQSNSIHDQVRAFYSYVEIAFKQLDYDKALSYTRKSLKIHETLGDSLEISRAYATLSRAYVCLRQSDSALQTIQVAINYFGNQKDTARSQVIRIQLGKAYFASDQYAEARKVLLEVVDETRKAKHYSNLVWALYWLGSANVRLGNFPQAISNFMESIEVNDMTKNITGKLGAMQELGDVYLTIGEFGNAYQLYFDCYQQKDVVRGYRGEFQFAAEYHLNIGRIYHNTERYNQALDQFDSAMVLIDQFDFSLTKGIINTMIGQTWLSLNDPYKALQYFEMSYQFYQEINSKYYMAVSQNHIAEVYMNLAEYDTAVVYLNLAEKTNSEIGSKFSRALNRKNLAGCYFHQKRYAEARAQIDACMPYVIESGINNLLLDYYALYITLCHKLPNCHQAGFYFEKFLQLNRQTNSQQSKNLTGLLLYFYTNELNTKTEFFKQTIDLQKLEVNNLALKFQLLLLFALVVILGLLVIGILYYSKIKSAKKLQRLVDERTHTIREHEQKLIKMSKDKDKIYSIIAHDLRSPFNSMLGFTSLLHNEYDDFSETEKKEFVRIIRNSTEKVFALLENLLEWARSSSGGLKYMPVQNDLKLVIGQILQLQERSAKEKNIELINSVPRNTLVYADKDMLFTIIRNLTSNAIKFTHHGGLINFSARSNNTTVLCTIKDTGIGIAPEDVEKLFCVDSSIQQKGTANENGTGLGLILVKDFVERNHGKLTVVSQLGEGSAFSFELPSQSPDAKVIEPK